MIGGLAFEPERDDAGKVVINQDTHEKRSNQFYRQKGGSLYFELASGGDLVEGLRVCLEAAKQEKCNVIYSTNAAGLVAITPEMEPRDAVNTFLCHQYINKEKNLSEESKRKRRIEAIGARKHASDGVSLYQIAEAKMDRGYAKAEVVNFCKANEIDVSSLLMHYEMALGADFKMENIVKYHDEAKNIDKKITEGYGIPYLIKEDTLPKLKESLVLFADSPKVEEEKSRLQQISKGKDFQNG